MSHRNTLEYPEVIKAQVCVIGSGIGGGTVSIELEKLGYDVVVIEAGNWDKHTPSVKTENIGHPFSLNSTYAIEVGGTSNLWHGVLAPLDDIDFKKREWISESGWPFDLDELRPYYKLASEFMGVQNEDFFELENLPSEIRASSESIRFDSSILTNKLFQQPLKVTRFKKMLSEISKKSSKIRIFNGLIAQELVKNESERTAQYLIASYGKGRTTRVEADVFIVAMGALQTPRLLLNSRTFHEKGIGNLSDCSGRFLMDHPMGNLCQVKFKSPTKARIYSDTKYSKDQKVKSGVVFTKAAQAQFQIPNHCFYFRPSFAEGIDDLSERVKLSLLTFRDGKVRLKDLWNVVSNPNVVRQVLAYKYSLNITYKYADLFFVSEQTPNSQSRVSLSDTMDDNGFHLSKVDWQVSKEDMDSIEKSYLLLRDSALSKDQFEFTHKFEDLNWDRTFTSAAHHVGTARISNSEGSGVVDINLKAFGTENVYVCDGSPFPTGGNVNSGLTICALGIRLARHLSRVHPKD